MLAALMDHPMAVPGAIGLVVLLVGLALYRLRGRFRKDNGETSFLESRLQPDSFFGASGGQRVDTRDATGPVVVDELLAEPARRDRRRRPGGRGRRLPGLWPRPAGRGNPQGGDARQSRSPGHPHQAARGLRQAARHQGLRVAGHAAVLADQGRGRRLGQGPGARPPDRPREPAVQAGRRAGASVASDGGRIIEPLGASTMPQSIMPSTSGFPPLGDRLDVARQPRHDPARPRPRSRPRHDAAVRSRRARRRDAEAERRPRVDFAGPQRAERAGAAQFRRCRWQTDVGLR